MFLLGEELEKAFVLARRPENEDLDPGFHISCVHTVLNISVPQFAHLQGWNNTWSYVDSIQQQVKHLAVPGTR